MDKTELLKRVTDQYLGSRDFNGLAAYLLDMGPVSDETLDLIREGVADGLVTVVFGDIHPNPAIKAFPDEPIDRTLKKLGGGCPDHAYLYPTKGHLDTVVKPDDYRGRPYALKLALGGAQLEHRAFDLHVLEPYRNDPRYSYRTDDIAGQINVKTEGSGLKKGEEVYLRFGFAYDESENKYVAGFLWDLFKLPPEAQQQWQMREVDIETMLHPEYYRTQILGDWQQHLSIYEAFTLELRTINEMAEAMDRPRLFRSDYVENRPKEFGSLLRPTVREFNDFVRLLDSMMSDNINVKFFGDDVPLEKEVARDDGKIQVERKGTIQVLQDWLDAKVRVNDRGPLDDMIATFREVRKLRSKPSHVPTEDEFSNDIAAQQRELMRRSYEAVRTLRLILANHPATKRVKVDDLLYEGRIWTK